jgi:acyl-coenzyme A synthetase/AMP-(fatty) acid ligase
MTEVNVCDSLGSKMRVVMSTAQAVSKELDQSFTEKFGVHISSQYGNTEIGCAAMGSADNNGVLTPLPNVHFTVFTNDADQNQLVIHTGKTGGYYILRDRLQCIHENGFRTSDIAELQSDGCIRLLGRADRVLIRAGEKLDAGYVEKILEGFAGIQKAAVHLNDRNELICSYATADRQKADIAAWKNYCRDRLLSYQIPEHFVYASALETVGKSWKEQYKQG